MKKFFLFAVLFFFIQSSYARYWIMFNGYSGLINKITMSNKSVTGHAYISFIKDDPVARQTVFERWGFYPKDKNDFGIAFVQGNLRNDSYKLRELGFMIETTKEEYEKCFEKKEEWKAKTYQIALNNCVSFVKDIVATINSMRTEGNIIEPSMVNLTPASYIKELKRLNPKLEFHGSTGSLGYSQDQQPVAKSIGNGKSLGAKTPEALAKLILKALATNDRVLWNSCILPPEGHLKTEQSQELIELAKKRFDDIKSDLEESGVSNFAHLKFSRLTYNKLPVDEINERGEQALEYFVIEFDYSPEFYGKIARMNVVTFKKADYFIYYIDNGSKLLRK